jgi:glutathione S-transferase
MPEIILHHYDISPFAELARVALGHKQLAWRSVIIPSMMPKPDLVELTGGYARTPVLQIDAEIYCDTAAILDALEALQPAPSLYPAPLGNLHRMIAGWTGAGQFGAHVGAAMRNIPEGALAPGFAADRKKRFVGFDFDMMPVVAPHLETQVMANADWLEALLADGRAFVGGDAPGHGDLGLYMNIWFLIAMPFAKPFADDLFKRPALAAWFERIRAIGHGTVTESDAEEAIAIAAASTPADIAGPVEAGQSVGQMVKIKTEHSGDDAVEGELLRCGTGGIAIRRKSDRAGLLNITNITVTVAITPKLITPLPSAQVRAFAGRGSCRCGLPFQRASLSIPRVGQRSRPCAARQSPPLRQNPVPETASTVQPVPVQAQPGQHDHPFPRSTRACLTMPNPPPASQGVREPD